MGSKTPPNKPSRDVQTEDTSGRSMTSERSAQTRLIGQIAGALQVPLATLYELPNAVDRDAVAGVAEADGASLGQECIALLRAFVCIEDPGERQRLLTLVRQAAQRA